MTCLKWHLQACIYAYCSSKLRIEITLTLNTSTWEFKVKIPKTICSHWVVDMFQSNTGQKHQQQQRWQCCHPPTPTIIATLAEIRTTQKPSQHKIRTNHHQQQQTSLHFFTFSADFFVNLKTNLPSQLPTAVLIGHLCHADSGAAELEMATVGRSCWRSTLRFVQKKVVEEWHGQVLS